MHVSIIVAGNERVDCIQCRFLKWYSNQKTLTFSSDFETLLSKHSPSKILGFNFEKRTVYLNYNLPIQWSAIITLERIQ